MHVAESPLYYARSLPLADDRPVKMLRIQRNLYFACNLQYLLASWQVRLQISFVSVVDRHATLSLDRKMPAGSYSFVPFPVPFRPLL